MSLFVFVMRWLFPAFGIGAVLLGVLGAPGRGEPPLQTLWSSAIEVRVREARIEESLWKGRAVYDIKVNVDWRDSPDGQAPLRGIGGRFYDRNAARATMTAIVGDGFIQVLQADGEPWVDRIDWFALTWTLFVVLVGLVIALVGVLFNRIMAPPQRGRQA